MIVYDKTKISKIKTAKTINETLNILKDKGNFITLSNYNLPYNNFSNINLNNIDEIFNKVLNDKCIFITTNSILNGYMETTKIPLFIAVNKNSPFYHKKYNETKTFFNVLTDAVKNYVNNDIQK